jgi:PPM family protein phosphatase
MTIGIRFAARSDVGMLREGNEDSAYAGSRLLAVADGMGGHVGGEIASAAAIETLKPLDQDVPAHELVGVLEQAVHRANETLHSIVESDPSLQGMGCTLTAMLWNGPQVALVHIGDSRAYLLRNGELFQITHDHTLVQSLVDEGRISLDEAASHPQRSLLLRALDGRGEVDPDISLREAHLGDRYLLCSDGLSTVVSAETIHHALSTVAEPDQAVRQLIDLANRGGGPDNITCVVADVVELEQQHGPPSVPITAGAAHNAGRGRGDADMPPPGAMAGETPAQRAAALRDPQQQQSAPVTVADMPAIGRQPDDTLPQMAVGRRRRRWPWVVAAAGAVVVLLAAGGSYVAWSTIQGQYYVAADGGQVVIYQGVDQEVLGFKLSHLKERPSPALKVEDLAPVARESVNRKIDNLGSLSKARTTISTLRKNVCHVVVADNPQGVVTIWKGKGQRQQGCDETALETPSPPVQVNQLPKATKDSVHKGLPMADVQQARTKVLELRDEVDQCRKHPGRAGCPPKTTNTNH